MTSRSTVPTTATPTDPQGTYVTYNYGTDADAGWSKLLTSITTTEVDENNNQTTSTQTIDYDAIGNPTSYLGANMTWFARQLKTYSKAGTTVSYTYDANGLRATKTVNGTKSTYVYVNGLLTYEKRGNIEIYFWYDSYGHLMALRCFGITGNLYYYVLTNIQGDVLGIYNGEGQLKVSYEYDTWGNLISMTDTSGVNLGTINPIRYRGYYFDEDTGLYYLQSRYYDPQVGRFINADDTSLITATPTELTDKNLYSYCDNNPVVRVDDGGRFWLYIAAACLTVVTVCAIAVVAAPVLVTTVGVLTTTSAVVSTATTIGTVCAEVCIASCGIGIIEAVTEDITEDIAPKRSLRRPAKRKRYSSRKKAYDAAKRAGKGKEPINHHHGPRGPHFHPDVSMPTERTPNCPTPHDHYYYPKGIIYYEHSKNYTK